jgi:ribosomal protein S13
VKFKDYNFIKHLEIREAINIIFKNSSGIGASYLYLIFSRFEINNKLKSMENLKRKYISIIKLLKNFLLKKKDIFKKIALNLIKLDLIFCYRAWRHFKGQPVRGQRTWTNATNASKINTTLKNLKFRIARNAYGNAPSSMISTAISAEQHNWLWYKQ